MLHKQLSALPETEAELKTARAKLHEMISVFLGWCKTLAPPQGPHSEMTDLLTSLQHLDVIVRASEGEASVTPKDLASALDEMSSRPYAAKLHDGLSKNLGDVTRKDSLRLLAVGEMDHECDDDFMEACSSIF